MNKNTIRNNVVRIRMLIIRIGIAAIEGFISSQSRQATLVPENDSVYCEPGYAALLLPEALRCGGFYSVAGARSRHRQKSMRSG